MLSQPVQDAMNTQIKNELYSAYLYLSMAAYFESKTLPGFATWMKAQYKEETDHALKFFEYLHDRGSRATLQAIDAPPAEFGSPLEAFQQVLKHEQLVTSLIHNLYALAVKENDYPSQVLLQWYINEQVEEEKNASQIVEQLKMIGPSTGGLFQLDHQLGHRGK